MVRDTRLRVKVFFLILVAERGMRCPMAGSCDAMLLLAGDMSRGSSDPIT